MPARAKLPPGKGKRVPLNMRTTQEVRDRLEHAAADSGRSLVQEVENRLEFSFLDEDAREREMGGRELHALFRMLGAVAEFIEERTGKKWSEDWDTGVAVQVAWKVLVGHATPSPPSEYHRAVNMQDEIPPLPPPPESPKRPPKSGLAPQSPLFKNEAEYQAAFAQWDAARAQWEEDAKAKSRMLDRGMRDLLALQDRIIAAMNVGKEAAELFPPTQSRD